MTGIPNVNRPRRSSDNPTTQVPARGAGNRANNPAPSAPADRFEVGSPNLPTPSRLTGSSILTLPLNLSPVETTQEIYPDPRVLLREAVQVGAEQLAGGDHVGLPDLIAELEGMEDWVHQIQGSLGERDTEGSVQDLILIRDYHSLCLNVHKANRFNRSNQASSPEIVDACETALHQAETALRDLREFFRGQLAPRPYIHAPDVFQPEGVGDLQELQSAQLAAQISAALGHYAGLGMDLQNWQTRLARLDTAALSPEDQLAHRTALLQAWAQLRDVRTGILPQEEGGAPITLSDTEISEFMRALRDEILDLVIVLDDANHGPELIGQLETRLNLAIDENHREFLANFTPRFCQEFIEINDRAQTLEGAMAEATGASRFLRQSQAAALYAHLGLREPLERVLEGASEYLAGLPHEAESIQGWMTLATLYRQVGLNDQARGQLIRINFVGSHANDAQSQDTATLAQAMLHLEDGELLEAQNLLERIEHFGSVSVLLEQVRLGRHRYRLSRIHALWELTLQQYISEGQAGDEAQSARAAQEIRASFREAMRQSQGQEGSNFSSILYRINPGHNFFDSGMAAFLDRLSDTDLSEAQFDHAVLAAAREMLHNDQLELAAHFARMVGDSPTVDDQVEHFLTEEMDDEIYWNGVAETLHGISYFIPYVNIGVISHDVWATPEDELGGTMVDVGLTLVGYGLATKAAVGAESLITSMRFAERLSPTALRATGWGAHTMSAAGTMTAFSMGTQALRQGSTQGLNLENFCQEFGAHMVTFGLLRVAGTGSSRWGARIEARARAAQTTLARAERTGVGLREARARHLGAQVGRGALHVTRWGERVGAITAADYANEGLGFREASNHSFFQRLLNSALIDAQMMAAHRVVNGMTRGGLEARQRGIQERYAQRSLEHHRARLEQVYENLEQNALIESGDPMSLMVRSGLEHSVRQTGNTQVAEFLATSAGRRVLFRAAEALGLEAGSRGYEMGLNALMLRSLEVSTSRGDARRQLNAMESQLGELAPSMQRLTRQMAEHLGQRNPELALAGNEGAQARLENRLMGQLVERALRESLTASELEAYGLGLEAGTLDLRVEYNLRSGEFHWDFYRAASRESAAEATEVPVDGAALENHGLFVLGSPSEIALPGGESAPRVRRPSRRQMVNDFPLRPWPRPHRHHGALRSSRGVTRRSATRPSLPPRQLTPRRGWSRNRNPNPVPMDEGIFTFYPPAQGSSSGQVGMGMVRVTGTPARSVMLGSPDAIFAGSRNSDRNSRSQGSQRSQGQNGSNISDEHMRTEISRFLGRNYPSNAAEGMRGFLGLRQMDGPQLRAVYALHQTPSRTHQSLFHELLEPHCVRNVMTLLSNLTPESSRGLYELIAMDPSEGNRSLVRRFLNTEWMYEPVDRNGTNRGLLALEAIDVLHRVQGFDELVDKICGEHMERGRWTQYSPRDQALWRGNVDEMIRLGHLQRVATASGDSSNQLVSVNHEFGRVGYRDQDGRQVTREMEADGLRRSGYMDELKSVFDSRFGRSGRMDFAHMQGAQSLNFLNQARKYSAAISRGLIEGVNYQITAASIAPEIIDFLRSVIPNLRIIRYDSISDTEGEVVYETPAAPPSFSGILQSQEGTVAVQHGNQLEIFSLPSEQTSSRRDGQALLALFQEQYETGGIGSGQEPVNDAVRLLQHQAQALEAILPTLTEEQAASIEEPLFDAMAPLQDRYENVRDREVAIELVASEINGLIRNLLTETLSQVPTEALELPESEPLAEAAE